MYQQIKRILVPTTKCILLLFLLNSCNLIRGTPIQKTHVVTSEDSKPVVLDCDYDADENNSTLVVKWLKDERPIYQWIKGRDPTVYPLSKGTIDEDFETSSNPNYKYRAISIPAPTKEMSGNYKCLVETMNSTESIQTHLQVIDVSNLSLELHSVTLSNDTLVTCAVENVFPEPKLVLWTNDDVTLSQISERVGQESNGFFNATVVVSASLLDPEDEIGCTLSFSGVEFNVTKIMKSSASSNKITALGIITMLMLLMSA